MKDKINEVKMEIAGAYEKERIIEKHYNFLSSRLDRLHTDITTSSIEKELNTKSSSVDTKPSIHKITKYTSDGKPANP